MPAMDRARIPGRQEFIAVLWPSFVVAGVFAGILFAFVDPWVLMDEVGMDSTSRLAGYSLAFLYFWAAGILAGFFALYIIRTPDPGTGGDGSGEPRG